MAPRSKGRISAQKAKRKISTQPRPRKRLTVADLEKQLNHRISELTNAREQQTATAEILQVISSSPGDLKLVFESMLAKAMGLCEAQCGFIYQMERGAMRAMAEIGVPPALAEYRRHHLHTGGATTPVDIMRATRKPAHVHDARHSDAYRQGNPNAVAGVDLGGARTVLYVPMIRNDDIVGVINLYRQQVRPFTEDQIALVENFASQAVIAVENARLMNELRERTGDLTEALLQQTATAEVLQVINSSPGDLAPVFDAMLERAMRLCEAAFGGLWVVDGDHYVATALRGVPPAYANYLRETTLVPGPHTAPYRFLHGERSAIQNIDLAAEQPYQAGDPQRRALVDLGRARTALQVPLVREEIVLGVITVYRQEVRPFSDKQIALLQNFADQAVIAIQNTRLFNETQEALERQTATSEILKVIASSPSDVQPVFDAITESARRVIGGHSSLVTRVVGDQLHLAAFTTGTEVVKELLSRMYPQALSSPFISARAARTGQVVSYADTERDADDRVRAIARARGYRSLLAVPMLCDGTAIGTINVTRVEPGEFDENTVGLLKTFADQAVIAIENARLFNETREALERQTATADILKVIASSPNDVQPVFDAIAQSAKRLFDAHTAVVTRVVGDMLHLAAFTSGSGAGNMALQRSFPFPLSTPDIHSRVVFNGTIEFRTDILNDPGVPLGAKDVARARGYRSILVVPMLRDAVVIGTLVVTRRDPGPFGDSQIELLKTFADQAVIAIANVELFQEVQARTTELTESLQQQTATTDVLKVISRSAFDLDTVMNTLARSARALCGSKTAALFLRDGDMLVGRGAEANEPVDADFLKANPVPLNDESHMGRAVLAGTIANIGDFENNPHTKLRKFQQIMGFKAFLAVPLMREGRGIGVFALTRDELGPFSERQVELVQSFADQAVIAIENTRLFNETKQALEQQTATADILKVIASSPDDVQPVFEAIAARSNQLVGGLSATVSTIAGDALHLRAFTPISPEADAALQAAFPMPLSAIPSGEAILRGETFRIIDIEADDPLPPLAIREMARLRGYRSALFVPLMREGKAIGTIAVTRVQPGAFADHYVQLLQTFADQAVIAIGNVRLFEEVQARTRELSESLEQQTATSEVLGVISRSAGDLEPVFQSMLENATRICGAQFGLMNLREGDNFRTVAFHNVPTPDLSATALYAEGDPPTRHLVDLAGARTILVVPMLKDGELVGTIGIYRHEVSPFNDKQIALLSSFASQAVIAIENTRLLKELRQRTDDLSQSLNELRTAQDRLVQTEKLASLGQLTAGIAHEIKNPLNFVNNFSALSGELIDELDTTLAPLTLDQKTKSDIGELTRTLKSNLEKVVQHGKRADSIVKNMLLHSREGSGERRSVDVNALVEESLNLAYHGARAERPGFQVTLKHDLDPGAGTIELYPQEITRVLLNMISNGFYAVTKRAGEVANGFEPTVQAATRGLSDRVEIRIRDNGTGIPPEVKDKMFNPFFTTKPAGEGTGLGLSMSHDIIVKQHGGTIDVETEPGVCTEFIITLPRSAAARLQNGSSNDR
jgi:GAF domain-containing protein